MKVLGRASVVLVVAVECRRFDTVFAEVPAGQGGDVAKAGGGETTIGGSGEREGGAPSTDGGRGSASSGHAAEGGTRNGPGGNDGKAGHGGVHSAAGATESPGLLNDAGEGGVAGANEDRSHGSGGKAGTGGISDIGGAGPSAPPGSAEYGAVRIFVRGEAVCGGTLINNSWVLTADHCFPDQILPASIGIGFGVDATNFEQVRVGVELQRFPGNGPGGRVRDLALVGVDAPFEINGSTTKHFIPLADWSDAALLRGYVCVGWDLQPDPTSSTDSLKIVALGPFAYDAIGDQEIVWWDNTDWVDAEHGTLLTEADTGSGCFYAEWDSRFLSLVHVGNPDYRREGGPNEDQEAYSLAVSDLAVHQWVESTTSRVMPDTSLDIDGAATACAPAADTVTLFARKSDHSLGSYRRQAGPDGWESAASGWIEQPSLTGPPSLTLSAERPGVLCWTDGNVELVVSAEDGSLWWQHYSASLSAWASGWTKVTDATTPVTSGVSAVGAVPNQFEVFARGPDNELRHARYASGWQGIWETASDVRVFGTPSVAWFARQSTSVLVRDESNALLAMSVSLTEPNSWYLTLAPTVTASPAVTSWSKSHSDVFYRDSVGQLGRLSYELWFSPWGRSEAIAIPANGDVTAVTREFGNVDAFVTAPGAPLRHLLSPRLPRAQ